jgi:phosphoribosylformylglycinamidine cyclo-ligase
MSPLPLSYKKSGVDIDKADRLVDFIQKRAPAIGGFSGLFDLKLDGPGPYQLVASTDGVGTKLKIAFETDRHHTVGIDLVAMCVNDLITCGAKPLFFLDYYATGRLNLQKSKKILSGILEGCRQGKMTLLGGETAEMPGFYQEGEYDLAGFSVGIVNKRNLIDGKEIAHGDVILGLSSSGVHSNGFSLVRSVFKGSLLKKYAPRLLNPTKIYVSDIEKLALGLKKRGHRILGLAHITGGGLIENVPRILPPQCRAFFDRRLWRVPEIFCEIKRRGNVSDLDMWRTFNMGIGMVVILRPKAVLEALKILPGSIVIGEIRKGPNGAEII